MELLIFLCFLGFLLAGYLLNQVMQTESGKAAANKLAERIFDKVLPKPKDDKPDGERHKQP